VLESESTKIRFLLDANVGRRIRDYLRDRGFDATWMIEIDPRMPDEEILRKAYQENRILITIDKDFGDLVYTRGYAHRGVIRLEDATPHIQIQYLDTLFREHAKNLRNNFIVAERGMIRIRPQP